MGASAEQLAQLAHQLDQFDKPTTPRVILGAALWYAEVGLHVFPLTPGAKTPLRGSRGCKEATTDPARIVRWWRTTPAANLGIATGWLVDVIDIDGPPGVKTWAGMYERDLPPVLGTVSTPRAGGSHLYVAAVPGRGNAAAIKPGIDYRGRGGYVVAPPSLGPNGVAYRWRTPLQVSRLKQ